MEQLKEIKFSAKHLNGHYVINISHNDLDGYGSSYILNKAVRVNEAVHVNYGEIRQALQKVGSIINEHLFIVITDLNLNKDEFEYLHCNFKNWLVIDHHGGEYPEFLSKEYPNNYILNTSISATKGTFNYFKEDLRSFFKFNDMISFEKLVNIINAYDMWDEQNPLFTKGMLLTTQIRGNIFEIPKIKDAFIKDFIIGSLGFELLNHTVWGVEKDINHMAMDYITLTYGNKDNNYIYDENLPLDIKYAYMHKNDIKDFITFENDDFYIIENISTKITQYTNKFFFEDEKYKDKVSINFNNYKGTIAFRSTNEKSRGLAQKCNGGGHLNAAGGSIDLSHFPISDRQRLGREMLIKLLTEETEEN